MNDFVPGKSLKKPIPKSRVYDYVQMKEDQDVNHSGKETLDQDFQLKSDKIDRRVLSG